MKYIKSIVLIMAAFALILISASTAYANPQSEAPATEVPEIADVPTSESPNNETEPPVSSEITPNNSDLQTPEIQQSTEPEANDPVVDTVPIRLQIHLGPHWAKTEFELNTESGPYPEAITVDDKGNLYLDIPDDGDIQLSVVNRSVVPPVPSSVVSEPENSPTSTPVATNKAVDKSEEIADDDGIEIPTVHIVLFAGGSVLCVGFLIFFFVRRRRRYDYYEDDDDYEDE